MTTSQEHYAAVNGLELYYEIHGNGRPLILLHGGLGTIDTIFKTLLPALAASRRVIAVELQGHGHTADPGRPMTFENMADDIAGLIDYLRLETADVAGFSIGGCVAQQLALRYPQKIGKIVVISAPSATNGWYAEVLAGTAAMDAEQMKGSPWHTAFTNVAPRPQDWPKLVRNVARLMNSAYDWTARLAEIKSPMLLIDGDGDSVRQSHMLAMFAALGGADHDGFAGGRPASQLFLVPGANHLNILDHPLLAPSMLRFLA
jgi:pimeloyl-ACP methyl ester carboxylesterase